MGLKKSGSSKPRMLRSGERSWRYILIWPLPSWMTQSGVWALEESKRIAGSVSVSSGVPMFGVLFLRLFISPSRDP